MYDVSQPDMYRANGVAVPLARDMVTEDRPLIYRVNMGEVGIFVEIELEDEYWEWRRYQLLKVSCTISNDFQKWFQKQAKIDKKRAARKKHYIGGTKRPIRPEEVEPLQPEGYNPNSFLVRSKNFAEVRK